MSDPEVQLYQAVIRQAGEDATIRRCCRVPRRPTPAAQAKALECARRNFRQAMRDRYAARRWLTQDSPDFREVCENAQIDARYVREGALALAANGWRAPSEAAVRMAA